MKQGRCLEATNLITPGADFESINGGAASRNSAATHFREA